MPRKPAAEPKPFVHLGVRIDPTLREAAATYAAGAGISLNAFVADALAEYVQRQARKAARQDQLELVGSK